MKALAQSILLGLALGCTAVSGLRAAEIHDAARAGDLDTVRRLLDASPDLDFDTAQETAFRCVRDATGSSGRRQAKRIAEEIRRELLLRPSP